VLVDNSTRPPSTNIGRSSAQSSSKRLVGTWDIQVEKEDDVEALPGGSGE
jgi:hypothetical protein